MTYVIESYKVYSCIVFYDYQLWKVEDINIPIREYILWTLPFPLASQGFFALKIYVYFRLNCIFASFAPIHSIYIYHGHLKKINTENIK